MDGLCYVLMSNLKVTKMFRHTKINYHLTTFTFCWNISMVKCFNIQDDSKSIAFTTKNFLSKFNLVFIFFFGSGKIWIEINNGFYCFADSSFSSNIRKQFIVGYFIKLCP